MTAKKGTRVINHVIEEMLALAREAKQPSRNMRHVRGQFKILEGVVNAAHKDTMKHSLSKRIPKNMMFDMHIDVPLNVLPQPKEVV